MKINNEKIGVIEKKLEFINKHRPLSIGNLKDDSEMVRVLKDFNVDFTYNSNAIEGSTITLDETYLILQNVTIGGKSVKEHFEVVNHAEAFNYILDVANDKPSDVLSESLIREIHSLVLANDPRKRGQYRNVAVRVGGYFPPDSFLVPELISQLVRDYNADSDSHILEKIAKFHLDFERIHPFADGNGRTGRLIINLELIKHGYPPVNIKFSDRIKYYDTFKVDDGSLSKYSKIIDLILNEVENSIEQHIRTFNLDRVHKLKPNTKDEFES